MTAEINIYEEIIKTHSSIATSSANSSKATPAPQ